jgi:hypothetical protein
MQRIPARRRLAQWLAIADDSDPGFDAADRSPNIALSISLLEQTVAQSKRVQLIDPVPALCGNSGQCVYRNGDRLLYVDSDHLSPDGAVYALRNFQLPAAGAAESR